MKPALKPTKLNSLFTIIFAFSLCVTIYSCSQANASNSTSSAATGTACAYIESNLQGTCSVTKNFDLNTASAEFSDDWDIQDESSIHNAAICANGEKELYYKDNISNDESGNLLLTLTQPNPNQNYHSAKLISKYLIKATTIPHGIVEFTAQIPQYESGAWPALWLYRYNDDINGAGTQVACGRVYPNGTWPRDGEIDVMEFIAGSSYSNLDQQMFSTLHYGQGWNNGTGPVNVSPPTSQIQHRQAPDFNFLASSYHNYAAEWNCKGSAPNFTSCDLTMFLDGSILTDENGSLYKFATINSVDTDLDSSFKNGFNNGFNIIMNFATGGNPFGNSPAAAGVDPSSLPLSIKIKQVTVYSIN